MVLCGESFVALAEGKTLDAFDFAAVPMISKAQVCFHFGQKLSEHAQLGLKLGQARAREFFVSATRGFAAL